MPDLSPEEIIRLLRLEPLEMEGGYFCQTYRSNETIPLEALPQRYKIPKVLGTAIYYLLTPDQRSALHRLPTDEIFHFYLGDPVTQLHLHPDGSSEVITLGADLSAGERPQVVVPRDTWQGALLRPGGHFALLGATMAPGFDYFEYEAGDRNELIKKYPDRKDLIIQLTEE
ncbi:cupin domain-containing protein [candidate division WOR-3 bacterium]|nr:cupin domain-containing protein [candidate division WOR-3 bacterium]